MKNILTMIAVTVSAASAQAWNGIHFGIEWGYTATAYQGWHHNYIEDAGFRVDVSGKDIIYNSNGLFQIHADKEVGDHLQIGLFSGYQGVRQSRTVIPAGLKASWMANGHDKDGPIYFIQGGGAFHKDCATTGILAVGGGYHLRLSEMIGLNLMLSAQFCGDHPGIFNIPQENVRRSDYQYGGINLTVGLVF